MTDPHQNVPAPQPPTAPSHGTIGGPAAGTGQTPAGQMYGAPAYPAPGYGAVHAAPGYAAPIAGPQPSTAGGMVMLALVFAGLAVITGWANTLGAFLSYRLNLPPWIFSLLGGLTIAVFDALALVFGIIAARRGGGVRAGIAIGVAIVGLLGLLFSLTLPALYSTLMRF